MSVVRITWEQSHLTEPSMIRFIAEAFGMDERGQETLTADKCFGCAHEHVGKIIEQFTTQWTKTFCDITEIEGSDPGDGGGPHSKITGPVLKVIVEPICDTMTQFGKPDTRDCKMMIVGVHEEDDPLEALAAMLGPNARVARGPDILNVLLDMMRDNKRDN